MVLSLFVFGQTPMHYVNH